MLPKKPVNNRNTGFFNTKQTKTKSIMDVKKLKKHFKNAKEVRCLTDDKIYNIDTDGYIVQITKKNFNFYLYRCQNGNSSAKLYLSGKYAEIISTIETAEDEYPKVMLVSFDKKKWEKRVVFMKKNKYFISWNGVETIKEAKTVYETISWDFAKELPKEIIVTKEEIAKWKGCDVKQLIIK